MALIREPSVEPYGLVPVELGPAVREAAAHWPSDELFLVIHRALRDVRRARVVWGLLLERVARAGS